MGLISLKTDLRQELKLTPQLLQSMEVLQMNAQELLEYLNRVTEENPVLEQEDSADLRHSYEELRQKASWLDGGVYGATFTHDDAAFPERGAVDKETESLSSFLCDQLERKRLPKPLLALAKYMAELVDEDGYLAPEDLDGLTELKIPLSLISEALETLQSLDPAGVGARSLSECLLLQLARQEHVSPAVMDITARFLPELGKKHYGPICRELGLTMEEVRAAEKVISGLDPHPGRAFQPAEPTVYVRPDVFIVELDGELRAVLNEYYLPQISVSDYYVRLLRESDEPETRDYLRQKLQQAKWLLNSLERRGGTLRRCADAILEAQRPFFTGQTTALAPMSLSTLADTLGLHPSTISRAVRGKYLQCRQGTYPLRYFFSRAVTEQGPSRQAVQQKLLALLASEDPCHPLSDQRLCRLLAEDGMEVARRTVAKYRMELGVGSSAARKHRI
ncbi:RNA polymerase factor sigma-54 [Oscillibacter valericigenes]|uniref:RNA polymerase factor sigma-54 n=1 Tax=Oscillibacter valericigenes TaxID=351091 RepID=UPI001F1DEF22|nr:RNA polymerase factor sigma-54 [Oscillibacter valericigenes]MCF2617905.1 RNA polymerase factor sigma-54 [Oscillibacter valericigenes]